MENKTDDELLEIIKSAEAERIRRRTLKDFNDNLRWTEHLKKYFPETQVGGTCKVYMIYEHDHIVLEFTPTQKIDGLAHCGRPPYFAHFEKCFDEYKLRIEFDGGFSSSWFEYRTDNNGAGPMYPHECNVGRCNKHFPAAVLILPWIGRIIRDPKEVHDMFIKMK